MRFPVSAMFQILLLWFGGCRPPVAHIPCLDLAKAVLDSDAPAGPRQVPMVVGCWKTNDWWIAKAGAYERTEALADLCSPLGCDILAIGQTGNKVVVCHGIVPSVRALNQGCYIKKELAFHQIDGKVVFNDSELVFDTGEAPHGLIIDLNASFNRRQNGRSRSMDEPGPYQPPSVRTSPDVPMPRVQGTEKGPATAGERGP
jgi:hypothetical protein